jgi:hypothetical protein
MTDILTPDTKTWGSTALMGRGGHDQRTKPVVQAEPVRLGCDSHGLGLALGEGVGLSRIESAEIIERSPPQRTAVLFQLTFGVDFAR